MMKIKLLLSIVILFAFVACDTKEKSHLDGAQLIKQKCASCHNLDLPPKTFKDEKAPPMMAVAFHIKDFIDASNASEKIPKAIEFIKDYVINPSASKSFCDKKSLQSYGVMPSQKGKVTQDELQVIGEYMFEHYSVKNLTEAQALQNKLNKMPRGERLALKYNCLTCHKLNKDLVGPSFAKIANKYKDDSLYVQESIKEGSVGRWKNFRGARMPAFRDKIADEDIVILSEWILKQSKVP
ncbi:c-type cytochrome [Sulfurimonas sp.]